MSYTDAVALLNLGPGCAFISRMVDLSTIRLFLFDVDGVFVAGKERPQLLSGRRILRALRERHLPFRLVTNTSTHPRVHLARELSALGLPVDPEEIHSAFETTVAVAARRFPGGRCFAIAETPLQEHLEAAGLSVVRDMPADVVVVALSRNADYESLSAAARCLKQGAALLACHRNRLWLDERGHGISAGAWVAALEYATGAVAESLGKPARTFFDEARADVGVPGDQTLMIGDDLSSDVDGAQQAGLWGGLVLTGKTQRHHLDQVPTSPDLVLGEVDDLVERL